MAQQEGKLAAIFESGTKQKNSWKKITQSSVQVHPLSPGPPLVRRLTVKQEAAIQLQFQAFDQDNEGITKERFHEVMGNILNEPEATPESVELKQIATQLLEDKNLFQNDDKMTYKEFRCLLEKKKTDTSKTLNILGTFLQLSHQSRSRKLKSEAKKQTDSNHNTSVSVHKLRRTSVDVQEDQRARSQLIISSHEVKANKYPWLGPWNRSGPIRKIWDVLIMIIVCLQILYIPFLIAFRPTTLFVWNVFEFTVDAVFICDMIFTFNTIPGSDLEDDYNEQCCDLVVDRREIAIIYFRGWFLLDFIASVPFDYIITFFLGIKSKSRGADAAGLARVLRIPRFFRILRMMRLFRLLRGSLKRKITFYFYYSEYSNIFQLLRFLLIIILICHYMACLLYGVCAPLVWFRLEDCDGEPCNQASTYMKYVTSFYTIFLLMNGEDIQPRTDGEKMFSVVVILLGSLLVATIFGNVAVIVTNFTAEQCAYRNKMTSLYEQMIHMRLPQELKNRIVLYYGEMWKNYRSLDGKIDNFIGDLNSTLESEVLLCMRSQMISNISVFAPCSTDVVLNLMKNLSIEIFQHGDYILRAGDQGQEMYIIGKGKCEKSINCLKNKPSPVEYPMATNDGIEIQSNEHKDSLITFGERRISQLRLLFQRSFNILPSGQVSEKEEIHDSNKSISPLEGEVSFRELIKGSIFGEAALIFHVKRGYNVRAAHQLCELHILSRDAFDECFNRHRQDKEAVKKLILKKYALDKENENYSDQLIPILKDKRTEDKVCEISSRLGKLESSLITMIQVERDKKKRIGSQNLLHVKAKRTAAATAEES